MHEKRVRKSDQTEDSVTSNVDVPSKTRTIVVGIVIVAVLILIGWLWFNDKADTPTSVVDDAAKAAGSVYEKAKDAVTPDKSEP